MPLPQTLSLSHLSSCMSPCFVYVTQDLSIVSFCSEHICIALLPEECPGKRLGGETTQLLMQDVIQNLLPYYMLDNAMTRFTAGPKAPTPEDLAPHQEECFSWGPGGSKRSVLGTWTAQHRNFFGDPHLQAIVHLAGQALSRILFWLFLRPAWAEYSSLPQIRV